MNCPTCNGQTRVIDTEMNEDSVKRRRKCLSCGFRFSTLEIDMDLYGKLRGSGRTAYDALREMGQYIQDKMKQEMRGPGSP